MSIEQICSVRKNMYTIIIIQSSSALTKRPSRFCRASVSHVARFLLYSLLFTAPDERGKGRIGASELRKTRGRPGKAFLRKRQQCPRQKGSSSSGRPNPVCRCSPRPSPSAGERNQQNERSRCFCFCLFTCALTS